MPLHMLGLSLLTPLSMDSGTVWSDATFHCWSNTWHSAPLFSPTPCSIVGSTLLLMPTSVYLVVWTEASQRLTPPQDWMLYRILFYFVSSLPSPDLALYYVLDFCSLFQVFNVASNVLLERLTIRIITLPDFKSTLHPLNYIKNTSNQTSKSYCGDSFFLPLIPSSEHDQLTTINWESRRDNFTREH